MSGAIFHAFLQGYGFFFDKLNKSILHNRSIQEIESFTKLFCPITYVKKNGISPETMKEWRMQAYIDRDTGKRWVRTSGRLKEYFTEVPLRLMKN